MLLPFQGVRIETSSTQGVTLGYVLLPFQGVRIGTSSTQGVTLGYVLLPFQGVRVLAKRLCRCMTRVGRPRAPRLALLEGVFR